MRQLEIKVPTFAERTFYLRRRLLSVSEEMRGLLDIKKECDKLAQQGARRMAVGESSFAFTPKSSSNAQLSNYKPVLEALHCTGLAYGT